MVLNVSILCVDGSEVHVVMLQDYKSSTDLEQ